MIPRAHVTAWRANAPWPTDAQMEQDLVLPRALVEMFAQPAVAQGLAFRGGSALHKLFLKQLGRYSEDIDLVQIAVGAIGPTIDSIRKTLDSWLVCRDAIGARAG
jgi:predicted nucleotidyltransferase component of viral defense system